MQKVKNALQHVVLASWRSGPVQNVKSALQHVVQIPWRSGPVQNLNSALPHVVLVPWRSGPVGTFYNPLKLSSIPPAFFLFLKKECSLSQKHM